MPAIRSLKPVRPRTAGKLSAQERRLLEEAMNDGGNAGYGRKAARLFEKLADLMQKSETSDVRADASAIRANADLLTAQIEIGRNKDEAEELLKGTLLLLDEALTPDSYWADYILLKDDVKSSLHNEIGCKIIRKGGIWEVHCIAVSRALGVPGLSRSERFDLECSICGQDPMFCSHIPGQVYGGRLALQVVRNLQIDSISILTNQIPEEPHIGIYPRPLTDADIKRFFNRGKAREILLRGHMRCGDLIRIVNQKKLGGTDFVSRGAAPR